MIVLALGGARSGKSIWAERRALACPGPHTYVSTAQRDPGDADLAARIDAHQARRGVEWTTAEAGLDLVSALRAVPGGGTILLDSLGPWVAATWDDGDDAFAPDATELCRTLCDRVGDIVVVSDEVGLGVHPSTVVGRRFRDALGGVNQAVAAVADEAVLVVAGRALRLEAAR